MGDSQKKVIVRQLAGPTLFGYLPATGFVQASDLSLLDLEGHVLSLPLASIRTVFFVRDFNRADRFNPERLIRKTFLGRPRGHGVWVRLALAPDSEALEGLAPLDRSLLDSLVLDRGLSLTPPDTRSNTLRLFVPHTSIAGFQVLGLVGAPKALPVPAPQPPQPELQESLFDPPASAAPPRRKAASE